MKFSAAWDSTYNFRHPLSFSIAVLFLCDPPCLYPTLPLPSGFPSLFWLSCWVPIKALSVKARSLPIPTHPGGHNPTASAQSNGNSSGFPIQSSPPHLGHSNLWWVKVSIYTALQWRHLYIGLPSVHSSALLNLPISILYTSRPALFLPAPALLYAGHFFSISGAFRLLKFEPMSHNGSYVYS